MRTQSVYNLHFLQRNTTMTLYKVTMFLILIFFVCMILLIVYNKATVTFIYLHHLSLNAFIESKSSNRVNCNVLILTDIERHDSWWQEAWLHQCLTVCCSMNKLQSLKNQTTHTNTKFMIDSLILKCFNNKNNVSLVRSGKMWDLEFSKWCWWRYMFSGIWHC
jgi:hypothetical protein